MADQVNPGDKRADHSGGSAARPADDRPALRRGAADDRPALLRGADDDGGQALDEAARDLTWCGACGCELVHPTTWEPFGARHWQVELRCPNCEARGMAVVPDGTRRRVELLIEHGAAQVALSLCDAIEERVSREVAEWAAALADGGLFDDPELFVDSGPIDERSLHDGP